MRIFLFFLHVTSTALASFQFSLFVFIGLVENTLSHIDKRRSEYEEWTIPVVLFDSQGPPTHPMESFHSNSAVMKQYPPRYSIGLLEIPMSLDLQHFSHLHFFTFDLGNPGQTLLLTEKCKGCFSHLEPLSGCPQIVPQCEDSTANNVSNSFCWPSHPDQYLPMSSFSYTIKDCPLKEGKDESAGTLDNIPVCKACFDGGDHSRFYSFAETDFYFSGATQTKRKNGVAMFLPAPMIKSFQFGALVRTVPLKDRIWSNIGIGAYSSFMNQLPAHSFMFDFDYYGIKTKKKGERIIFNPDPSIFHTWPKSPYVVDHHRHHTIERFYFGSEITNGPVNISFFMDTGNDGISIFDEDLSDFLVSITAGVWMEDESDPNNYGEERLFVPYSRDEAPELTLVLSPGIPVTLPGYAWVFKNKHGNPVTSQTVKKQRQMNRNNEINPTIFVKDKQNILGLPFLSAPGYSFVFDDTKNLLYIGKESKNQLLHPVESSFVKKD